LDARVFEDFAILPCTCFSKIIAKLLQIKPVAVFQ
jgi:hypothetical protein